MPLTDAEISAIKVHGPTRIVVDRFGHANSPKFVPTLWNKIGRRGLAFVRNDGLTIGCERYLAKVAYDLWDKDYTHVLDFATGEVHPIKDWLEANGPLSTPIIVDLTDAQSKSGSRIAYDGKILQVTFKPFKEGGKVSHYRYENVTPKMFEECRYADRPMEWLRNNGVIKRKGQPTDYPYVPLDPETNEVWA